MSEKIEVVGGGETVEVSGDGDTVTIVGGGESVSIDIVEIGGTGKGIVIADNAPADTSVLWADTSVVAAVPGSTAPGVTVIESSADADDAAAGKPDGTLIVRRPAPPA